MQRTKERPGLGARLGNFMGGVIGKETPPTSQMGVAPKLEFKMSNYVRSVHIKTESGRYAVDNDDETAQALRGLSLDEVYAVVSRCLTALNRPITEEQLRDKYTHLNAGLQRMAAGNLLRGRLKNKKIKDIT